MNMAKISDNDIERIFPKSGLKDGQPILIGAADSQVSLIQLDD